MNATCRSTSIKRLFTFMKILATDFTFKFLTILAMSESYKQLTFSFTTVSVVWLLPDLYTARPSHTLQTQG